MKKKQIIKDGDRNQKGTKTQKVSYEMMDSPVGVEEWSVEKMHGR